MNVATPPAAWVPVQAIADSLVAAGAPGAIVARLRATELESAAAGHADLDVAIPMQPSDRLRIGSITKTFVAAAVLLLAQRGAVDLDAGISDYVPAAHELGERITVRQLLAMRSGLPDYAHHRSVGPDDPAGDYATGRRDPGYVWAPSELMDIARSMPDRRPPGGAAAYSNSNYLLLGLLLEAVTGASAATALGQLIIGPLSLSSTALETDPPAGTVVPGYGRPAPPFSAVNARLGDSRRISASVAWTGGAMVSTASDVARFYGALFGGELLEPQMLEQLREHEAMPDAEFIQRYGLGIVVNDRRCGRSWGHMGAIWGYVAEALASYSGELVCVLMLNLDAELVVPILPTFARAIDELFCPRIIEPA